MTYFYQILFFLLRLPDSANVFHCLHTAFIYYMAVCSVCLVEILQNIYLAWKENAHKKMQEITSYFIEDR